MRVITTSIGKRPTRLPVCVACFDLVFDRQGGGRCQNPKCRKFYSDLEIAAALGLAVDTSEPALQEAEECRG